MLLRRIGCFDPISVAGMKWLVGVSDVIGRVILFGLGRALSRRRGLGIVGSFGTTVRTLPTGVNFVHRVFIKLGTGSTRG